MEYVLFTIRWTNRSETSQIVFTRGKHLLCIFDIFSFQKLNVKDGFFGPPSFKKYGHSGLTQWPFESHTKPAEVQRLNADAVTSLFSC